MKIRSQITAISLIAAALTQTQMSASADQQIPAKEAINRIAKNHGTKFIEKIVEMKGARGQAQPEEWEIIVYDAASENLLREFWVGDTRATNEGVNYDYYPKRQPDGFINLKRIKLGSMAAFKVLDEQAARAKIGFDSIDYHLRCREFSDEPIWTLTAKDADGYQVGRVDLSADNGRVLRTVWSYREGRRQPVVKDSALSEKPAQLDLIEDDLAEERRRLVERAKRGEPIAPKARKDPEVPEPIDPTPAIEDPETEVPEVRPIDPEDRSGADEP